MFLDGPYKAQREELSLRNLKVHGEIPKDLNGTFYRVGSSPLFDPIRPEKQHWFSGDGMVHAITLEEGKAHIKNRYVDTPMLQLEKAAGRALYGDMINGGTPIDMNSGRPPFKNVANTNVMEYCGELMVFWEFDLPHRLDIGTLDTLGQFNFGELQGSVTAHYKINPKDQSLLFYGYMGPAVTFYHADVNGNMINKFPFMMEHGCMMHDFAVTENYAIFFTSGALMDLEGAIQGKPGGTWNSDIEAKVAVMEIKTGKLKWYSTGQSFCVTHFANAFERNGKIIVDVNCAPDFNAKAGMGGNPFSIAVPWRWEIDLATGRVSGTTVSDMNSEFAKINDNYTGLEHNYAYYAATTTGEYCDRWLFDKIAKMNTETGEVAFKSPAEELTSPGEVTFIPRAGATSEDDGYLVNLWWNQQKDESELVIMAAQDINAAPLARIELAQRVPMGFHGSWASAG